MARHCDRMPSRGRLSVLSNKNQVRPSASSIHGSITLALATSPFSSHSLWISRIRAASWRLSSRSSASLERSDVVGIIIQTRWRREICPMERIVVPRPCVPVRLSHLTSQVSRGNQFHRIRGQIGRCPERRRPAHLRVLQCHLCHSLQSIDLFIGGSALPTMKVAYTSSFQYSLTSYLRTSSTQVVWSPCRGMSRL